MNKKNPFKKNKHEIMYNLINSALAGALVFMGSLSQGNITIQGVWFSLLAGAIILITKFKNYWDGEKGEYSTKLFSFIN